MVLLFGKGGVDHLGSGGPAFLSTLRAHTLAVRAIVDQRQRATLAPWGRRGGLVFNAEQQKRVDELCKMIAGENDYARVAELARELNQLLEAKGTVNPVPDGGEVL